LEVGIERFLALFANFDPGAVQKAALETYASTAYFNDGFAEIEGREAIVAYLVETAAASSELIVEIEDRVVVDGEVYLRWVMTFTTTGKRGRTIVTPGITHLRFDTEGRIAYHHDYWDSSGALAEFVPGVGPLLRKIKSRFETE
jgi:limonene-1,2-epoxide hydrolase